jgi:F0F1-type ATP synthase delta subunit
MILDVCKALMMDTMVMLKAHQGFFELGVEEKKKHVQHFPQNIQYYLTHVKEDDFGKDLIPMTYFLSDPDLHVGEIGGFMSAFCDYLIHDFTDMLDAFESAFFLKRSDEREAILRKAMKLETFFQEEVLDVFSVESPQDINEAISAFLKKAKEATTIVVQTPVDCEKGMKKEIRDKLAKDHPYSFVEFYTSPQILGGMRVFVNGEVADMSWRGLIGHMAEITPEMVKQKI